MAKHGVFKNGFIEIAGVDLSDHCLEFDLNYSAEELANHCHGDDVAQVLPGLMNWTIKGRFLQDFAASSSGANKPVDSTFWSNLIGRTAVPVRVRADAGAASSTNPTYSGMGYLMQHPPMGGAHGVNLQTEIVVRPASGSMLSRLLT